MNNRFSAHGRGVNSPPDTHYSGDTVKSDTALLPEVCREVYVGLGGNVKLTDLSGWTGVFENVPAGYRLIGFWTQLHATGTTASSLILAA